jgi:acetolactate synthase-1/2/3 large subunit
MMGTADGDATRVAPPKLGPADPATIAEAAVRIKCAEHPLLLLGLLASEPRTTDAVRSLLAKTKIPVICTYQGAGVVPREQFDLFGGRIGLFRNQPGDRLLDTADVVITVGYDPVEYEPGLWNHGKTRDIVHIDAVPADIDRDYRSQFELTGDTADTLRALAIQLDRRHFAQQAAAINGIPIHPTRLAHEIQDLLSDDMTLCLDMGSFHIWLARHLYSFRPRQILMSNGQQTLGVGLPWAIAACLVRPGEKVVSISGDGGFLFSAAELETAVRLKSNLVHLVWIDGTYDMVRFQEMAKYGRASGVEFGPVDVVKFAESFGAKGLLIQKPDESASTLERALAMEGPVVVAIPVDYRDNHRLMEIVQPNVLN